MVKAAKVRKTRVMTDEQKAAFRARMIAGREAKAAAEIKSVEPVKSDVNPVAPAMVKSKTNPKSKPAKPDATKPSPKVSTMPRNGHKVAAKPASL